MTPEKYWREAFVVSINSDGKLTLGQIYEMMRRFCNALEEPEPEKHKGKWTLGESLDLQIRFVKAGERLADLMGEKFEPTTEAEIKAWWLRDVIGIR